MAVAPTGAIYKTLTFDGVSSADFGVYITGEAVFNAPQRDVEMVTIPGRNGTFALDNGRFENIEVSYPAGIFADTEADFAEAVSEFRNFLCSRNGYVRLEDDYNTSEYRMAVYKSGLEVTPALLRAGEFTLTFDCKPQRWLTSGEEAITVDSGDTITNPTRFESGPMLEVEGYGNISFNGYDVEIENGTLGEVILWNGYTGPAYGDPSTSSVEIPVGLLNTGDTIILDNFHVKRRKGQAGSSVPTGSITSYSHTGVTGVTMNCWTEITTDGTANAFRFWMDVQFPRIEFEYGTPDSLIDEEDLIGTVRFGQSSSTMELHVETSVVYDGDRTITFSSRKLESFKGADRTEYTVPQGMGISSVPIMGHPTYVDCDLGEAYKIEDGAVVSLNKYLDLGSDLPVLAVGETEITFDNTITNLDVIPRWWKV